MPTTKPVCAHIPSNGDEPATPVAAPLLIAMGAFNILVAIFFLLFAWEHSAAFVHTLRISNLIILIKSVLDLQFYARRSTTPFAGTSAYAWLIALSGTLAPLMFRPKGDVSDFWLATLIQVVGLAMQIHIIKTRKRSFELAVARHGIREDGLYRFVRHPMYLAFTVSQFGYALNHTSFYNLGILALMTFFQVLRINEEERLLLEDEEYQAYAAHTPWRVIPGVF